MASSDDPGFDPGAIDAFIRQADDLPGSPVAEVASQVAQVMEQAWQAIAHLTSGLPNNKLIAVMLLLSKQAQESPAEEAPHWYLHASSTMVSGRSLVKR